MNIIINLEGVRVVIDSSTTHIYAFTLKDTTYVRALFFRNAQSWSELYLLACPSDVRFYQPIHQSNLFINMNERFNSFSNPTT